MNIVEHPHEPLTFLGSSYSPDLSSSLDRKSICISLYYRHGLRYHAAGPRGKSAHSKTDSGSCTQLSAPSRMSYVCET